MFVKHLTHYFRYFECHPCSIWKWSPGRYIGSLSNHDKEGTANVKKNKKQSKAKKKKGKKIDIPI